jgi:hypothetical protein
MPYEWKPSEHAIHAAMLAIRDAPNSIDGRPAAIAAIVKAVEADGVLSIAGAMLDLIVEIHDRADALDALPSDIRARLLSILRKPDQ